MSSSLLSSTKHLTILFIPFDGFGHVHACVGIAELLKQRGHRIVFGVTKAWKGKLLPYGFEEVLYGKEETPSGGSIELIKSYANELRKASYDQIANLSHQSHNCLMNAAKSNDSLLHNVVQTVIPDIIIIDQYLCQPSLTNAGIPWIWLMSANPLGLNEENCPPRCSGYPTNGDRSQWDEFRKEIKRVHESQFEEFNRWIAKKNAPLLTKDMWPFFHNASPYLNIYLYPEDMDYTDLRPNPPKWFRCDPLIRASISDDVFKLPEKIADKPGKLIYVSIGSFISADLFLMKRLIEILGKSRHRFIISKGPLADQYSLPDNMWGEDFLAQVEILPLVDLVITHGGNNTINEILYFGKPSIVLPIFVDQFDNAQRMQEKGFGIRLNPYSCSENELLDAIENLLADQKLSERLTVVSKTMREKNNGAVLVQLIEAVVENKKT